MPAPTGLAPVAAAAISKKRRRIIRAFRDAAATTPETSKTLDEVGLSKSVLLETQRLRGVLVESPDHHFFLDEGREREVSRFRRILVSGIAAFALLLVFAGWWLGKG